MKRDEKKIIILDAADVAKASSEAMRLGKIAGFSHTQQYMIATSVSELGTNIYRYAREGEITVRLLENGNKKGIEIIAHDKGPGITDLEAAMKDHFSTSGSLGLGLPGVNRMMDEFEIDSKPGTGTRIIARKWMN